MKKVVIFGFVVATIGIFAFTIIRSNGNHQEPQPSQTYVALGDSVAAGLGLSGTKNGDDCGRAVQAYPNIVAAQKKLKLIQLSCSGATLNKGILGSQNGQKPQIEQIFEEGTPTLITATIGANDLEWTKFLAKCYAKTCGTSEDTAYADGALKTIDTNLRILLDSIQAHGPHPPKTILTAYYQVLPASKQDCPRVDELADSEFKWFQAQETKLNKTIQGVVKSYQFARYAPIDYTGHDICAAGRQSWIQSVGGTAPFHPTAIGQSVIAGAVLAASNEY